ncbi:hypothetical protein C3495_14090 (plasmid) [Clostridiaceae bacterium 14S0207]|nr:hypothetical protein C3495_14090 [Clostridiaceae bacterium 14S0207]
MKIKIDNKEISEKMILNFCYGLSLVACSSLFILKIVLNTRISWFLIIFCLVSSLYFYKLANNN